MRTAKSTQRLFNCQCIFNVGILTCCVSWWAVSNPVIAQTPSSPDAATQKNWWNQLQKADKRITACRVTWKRELSVKATPKVDVEKRVARAKEQAQQSGKKAEEIEKEERSARNLAQDDRRGRQVESILSFVRVGHTIRCDIAQSFARISSASADAALRYVEFYDGKNSVLIRTEVQGVKEVPPVGMLRRDEKEILSHSAANWFLPQLLLGIPLSQQVSPPNPSFSPVDSSLIEGSDNTLTLERKIAPSHSSAGFKNPALLRLSVSKEHLRPLTYESLNLLYRENEVGRVDGKVSVSGYRRYTDGIWFPSKIIVTTSAFKIEYTLIKAAFNEAIDPMELRLPSSTLLGDLRFDAANKVISYKLKNGLIPSDEEVKKMLSLDKEAVTAKDATAKETANPDSTTKPISSLPIAPVAGLLLMAMGCMMWMRSARNEHNA